MHDYMEKFNEIILFPRKQIIFNYFFKKVIVNCEWLVDSY